MATMTDSTSRIRRVTDPMASSRPDESPLDIDPKGAPPTGAQVVVGRVGVIGPDGRRAVEVVVDGWRFDLVVEDAERAALRERASRARTAAGAGEGPTEIRAIIPGRIAAVAVVAGDAVSAGQPILVVEAMKMQNDLRAPRDGTVARVVVSAGQTIEIGDLLVVLA